MTCVHCGNPLDPEGRNIYRLVQGWERVRQTGEGVHPAHLLCLEAEAKGGSQEALAF